MYWRKVYLPAGGSPGRITKQTIKADVLKVDLSSGESNI
jgi:hypothetical protein